MPVTIHLLTIIVYLLDAIAVVIIAWGALQSAWTYFKTSFIETFEGEEIHAHERVRVELGQRIVLALEFLVAGDIIQTVMDPSRQDLLNLGIIVLVRTILSFFVSREIQESLRTTTMKGGKVIKEK